LRRERRVPALRVVAPYYSHSAYLDALVAVLRDDLARRQRVGGALSGLGKVNGHGQLQLYNSSTAMFVFV
jgi:hypothetical protein